MSRYCFNTTETKSLKKFILNFSSFEIDSESAKGKVNIFGYRKYQFRDEFDIEFIGQIKARVDGKLTWVSSEVLKRKNISKIKVNRFLRKEIFKVLKVKVRYFSIDIRYYYDIKKLKWT